jgi:very-short-patch-repair endonuclease
MGTKNIHNRKSRKEIRKRLRSNLTPAEAALWLSLQRSKLGVKFRRQHGVGPFVVDFYCAERRLAVELEGEVHRDVMRSEYDAARHAFLASKGIRVLYFENRAVAESREFVLETIRAAVAAEK